MHETGPVSNLGARRLMGPFATFGGPVGIAYAIQRCLQVISPRLNLLLYEFMVQPVPSERPMLPPREDGLRLREIVRGSALLQGIPVGEDTLEFRYSQGARCLGGFRDSELVGYVWYCRGQYVEDEARFQYELEPVGESAFDFDFYIFPRHRLGRTFAEMWGAFNDHLCREGIKHTYSRVSRFNLASRRSHARLGARRIGMALTIVAWRLELKFMSLPPFLNATFTPGRRARIALSVTRRGSAVAAR